MRWLEPEVTEAATAEPVSLVEAKAHLRVDDTDQDTLISALISAARGHVEAVTGLSLCPQTIVLRAWGFDACTFRLPCAPVQEITSVTYLDAEGAEQTLSTDVYAAVLVGMSPTVTLKYGQTWPAHRCGLGNVTFTLSAGYPDSEAGLLVPPGIKQAILLIIGDLFANRETAAPGVVSAIPMSATVDALLANYRRAYL